ncbi:hypothetical protein PILCRDRAFT_828918 [Piloderma croceum F 1598]|uniref:DUF6533 domain-containing protein n=1 Tax=Piloderma croceum (strain F 1598) TaxID=765440 RepID=A0A0C3F0M4_PILCF|nr:hypothetical protein PILCRDRAFT_828918 [Piloderma croceum F 1598]
MWGPVRSSTHPAVWQMSQASDVRLALAANYTNVAFVVILLYDYVLTFGMEVEFIWKQKMGLGKILFLLNRYVPIIDLVILINLYTNPSLRSDQVCSKFFHADKWIGMFSVVVIDALLVLRTWALWGLSKLILLPLGILLALSMMAQAWSIKLAAVQPSPDNVRPCASTEKSTKGLYLLWAAFIVFDSTVITLTLIKAVPSFRRNTSTSLITRLLKDGIQYFLVIFLASLANIIMISAGSAIFASNLVPSYRATIATLGSRLILNLRGSLLRPAYNDGQTVPELNVIMFNSRPNQPTFDAYSMEDIENPEVAVGRRNKVPQRTSEYSSSLK